MEFVLFKADHLSVPVVTSTTSETPTQTPAPKTGDGKGMFHIYIYISTIANLMTHTKWRR